MNIDCLWNNQRRSGHDVRSLLLHSQVLIMNPPVVSGCPRASTGETVRVEQFYQCYSWQRLMYSLVNTSFAFCLDGILQSVIKLFLHMEEHDLLKRGWGWPWRWPIPFVSYPYEGKLLIGSIFNRAQSKKVSCVIPFGLPWCDAIKMVNLLNYHPQACIS